MTLRHAQGRPELRRGVRIFGIDPGSERTGYGCVETDGRRHRLVACGAIAALAADPFPMRLARIHRMLADLLARCRPDCVAVETLFHAANARSALKLGHARGVAILAAVEAGCPIVEYSPAEIKRALVGYGRAEKHQVQQMVALLLGLREPPTPYDAADALAVAICHSHMGASDAARLVDAAASRDSRTPRARASGDDEAAREGGDRVEIAGRRATSRAARRGTVPRSWRHYRPPNG